MRAEGPGGGSWARSAKVGEFSRNARWWHRSSLRHLSRFEPNRPVVLSLGLGPDRRHKGVSDEVLPNS